MKLTKPMYTCENKKSFILTYDFSKSSQEKYALNLLGCGWIDSRFGLIKSLVKRHTVVVTDSDLLAHDDYLEELELSHIILFVKDSTSVCSSEERLKIAVKKLKSAGILCKYLENMEKTKEYLKEIGEQK